MTNASELPVPGDTADDSSKAASARSVSPMSRYASPARPSAWSRHGLHGGSWATANVASVIACSGPAGHIAVRSIALAEAKDAVPSAGVRSKVAASTIAAHRWASAVCPVIAVTHPAKTASGGYPSIASLPSADSHRWTVDICPAAYVSSVKDVARCTQRSRSSVFSRW